MQQIEEQCQQAKASMRPIQALSSQKKADLLVALATAWWTERHRILAANARDISTGKAQGIDAVLVDRLRLDDARIRGIVDGVRLIATLDDPVGTVLDEWTRPNGLRIQKIRVPLGVIAMIYEARPNVTADAISLALKTNNTIVLRGSASAYQSNAAFVSIAHEVITAHDLPSQAIQLIEDLSHESVSTLLTQREYVDLIIPRGGANLIQRVVRDATIPSIETGVGLCHVYVDKDADSEKAWAICVNAKVHRPSVCNAAETFLIHADCAERILPQLGQLLHDNHVTIYGCPRSQKQLGESRCLPATDDQWATEYLALAVSIKIVSSLDEALSHIDTYGSLHTESVVTESAKTAARFMAYVDASTVMHNASTRFTDGGEFGFGAEIGVSTQKLHARGPMGLAEITSYKYLVHGDGHVRG